MPRLRLLDARLSELPQKIGFCQGDVASIASAVNRAQERLLTCREVGEQGWYGSWARTVFNVSRANPYITAPREVARIQLADVCQKAIGIQNDFYQFLEWGNGLLPATSKPCQYMQMYRLGTVPTFVDIAPSNQSIRVFATDPADYGKRTLIQGLDNQGNIIRSTDGLDPTLGEYLVLNTPFTDFPMEITSVTGIQKDVTVGVVKYYQLDLTSGDLVLILTMEPGETVAEYVRYQIAGLPNNCCHTGIPGTTQVTCMTQVAFIPAQVDSDWLMFHSPGGMEALIAEAQSTRFDGMDAGEADQKLGFKHHEAVGYLNGQLAYFLGKTRPAAIVKPFGNATLQRQRIGTLI